MDQLVVFDDYAVYHWIISEVYWMLKMSTKQFKQ